MSRTCTVCKDLRVEQINQSMVSERLSLDKLAAKFPEFSRSVLDRHRVKCLPALLARSNKSLKVRTPEQIGSALEEFARLALKVEDIMARAKLSGDARLELKCATELRATWEILGKANGELAPDRGPENCRPMFTFEPGCHVRVDVGARPLSVEGRKEINVTPEADTAQDGGKDLPLTAEGEGIGK